MTADIGALTGDKKSSKKSRSKSIGPGGLDALKDTTGNRRKVGDENCRSNDPANASTVAGSIAPPYTKIYLEAHNATPPRNPGACVYGEDKSQVADYKRAGA